MDVTTAERMIRDVFPADVLIEGKIHTKTRVFITTERIQVYVKDQNDKAHLLVEAPVTNAQNLTPSRNTLSSTARLHVDTGDGTISVARGRGCSCGALATLPGPISWSRR